MSIVTRYRIEKLKAMHEMMLNVNDERYYMAWIYTMPDCPTEYDFIDIAEDIEAYNEIEEVFKRLITESIKNDEF